jgi:hypothetical protein
MSCPMLSAPLSRPAFAYLAMLLLAACTTPRKQEERSEEPARVYWEEVATDADTSASAPAFHNTGGRLFLTWVEQNGETYLLQQAEHYPDGFDEVATIRSGKGWMVHWADLPGAAGAPSDRYAWHAVHNPAGDHATDISLYRSVGNVWSGPLEVHRPTPVGEHAFVSACALPEGGLGMAWLQPSTDTVGGHKTELAFRSYLLGQPGDLQVLDGLVCDCCPTSMASTDSTVLVVYRDRSATGVRDISYQLWDHGQWSGPQPLGEEGWEIDGCPVNGPAVAAKGQHVVIAWWTQAEGQAAVRCALSSDYGRTFDPIRTIDQESPIGQVGVAMSEEARPMVTWLAPMDSSQQAILAYFPDSEEYDTVAVFPAGLHVGKPIAIASPYMGFLVTCKREHGIAVYQSGR